MYINFWYPIAKSEEVKTYEPFRSEVLGLKFVAFRDEDHQAHVLSDTCVHRGGSLGKGWMKDGCVVCPYHGWYFAGDGKCTTIPSIGYDGKPPPRAKVDSYPVQEKYGMVFAFLGDLPEEERPPLYEIEEYDQEGWRANQLIVFEVDYYYERSVENGIDPAHNEFVHPTHGFSGMKADYHVKDFTVDQVPYGCWFDYIMESSSFKDDTMQQVRQSEGQTNLGGGTYAPNVLITKIRFTAENAFCQYFFEAPINEKRTRIYFVNMRNCLLHADYDERIRKRCLAIAQQDIEVLDEVDPILTPESTTKEVLMPADKIVVAYRDCLRGWENQGWRIDTDELNRNRGKVAYAIPGPERRTSGNWVLDPIPLITAAEELKAATG
jgi:phenylpropionate dioxygenase-like ring-hydroxylating dioxygenase large terminal subunit